MLRTIMQPIRLVLYKFYGVDWTSGFTCATRGAKIMIYYKSF
ncbi:MAG: hypothetical protein QXD19_02615 [Candidatus Bathyarchaeia archaeon]